MKKNLLQNLNNLNGGGIAFSIMMMVYVFVSFLGQTLVGAIFGTESVSYTAICSCFSALTMLITLSLFKFNTGEKLLSLTRIKPFKWYFSLVAIVLSAAMFFGLGFVNDALVRVFEKFGVVLKGIEVPLDNVGQYIVFSVVLGLLPAVFEEIFFRGLIIKLLDGAKPVYVIIAVALCFSLYHCSAAQFAYQLVYGALLTLLALAAKSSIPSIIAHFINNFAVITLQYFNISINLYHVASIISGTLVLAGITALLFLILNKNKNTANNKITADNKRAVVNNGTANGGEVKKFGWFYAFASMGIIICVALMLGTIITSLSGGMV